MKEKVTLRELMIKLLHSWQDADENQIKKWENSGNWPKMDALIAFYYLTDQINKQKTAETEFVSEVIEIVGKYLLNWRSQSK